MLRTSSCLSLALLFLASALPSNAQKSSGAGGERRLAVAAGAPLAVECSLRLEQRAHWRLDGRAVPADMRAAEAAPGGAAGARLSARLEAPAARAAHAGLYTCADGEPPVRVVLLPAAAAPAGATEAAGEPAGAAGGGEGGVVSVVNVDLKPVFFEVRGNLSLDCRGLAGDTSGGIKWFKNNTEIEKIPELKDRYTLSKEGDVWAVKGRAHEDDFGNYTCAAGDVLRRWQVRGRTHAKLPANTNVVEGQKLKLQCRLLGKPYRGVTWTYSNSSESVGNGSLEVTAALGERATLQANEQGVPEAELVIDPAQRSDAGWYRCAPKSVEGGEGGEGGAGAGQGVGAVTTLRVKDMYAALWPFLGICAEVFVLCAIILVYEKRRTKPELDDSDTDNHDQKKS